MRYIAQCACNYTHLLMVPINSVVQYDVDDMVSMWHRTKQPLALHCPLHVAHQKKGTPDLFSNNSSIANPSIAARALLISARGVKMPANHMNSCFNTAAVQGGCRARVTGMW